MECGRDASGADRHSDNRGQRDETTATRDEVAERMTRMERLMERVLYTCSVIEQNIDCVLR